MAILTIKSTYSLDPETVRALQDMARRWGVSKSEALRRAVRAAAAENRGDESEILKALDELQRSMALTRAEAQRWTSRVRAERRASSARHRVRGS